MRLQGSRAAVQATSQRRRSFGVCRVAAHQYAAVCQRTLTDTLMAARLASHRRIAAFGSRVCHCSFYQELLAASVTKGLRATLENIEPAARPQLSPGFNAIGERSHVLR
jgi:hypothetical protein